MVKFSRKTANILGERIIASVLVISSVISVCSCTKGNTGFDGKRFSQTRHITVLVDSLSEPDMTEVTINSSCVAQYIHESVLKDCNIDVTFLDAKNYRIERGIGADINLDNRINIMNTYYKQNGLINLEPYFAEYGSALSDLSGLLGDVNLHYCSSDTNDIWYLSPRDFEPDAQVTFIRQDWLDKLGLKAPSTREELYNCLKTFRDNADVLLENDSDKMIPFFVDCEPNISAKPLFDSCLDTSISLEENYYHGFCRVTQSGYEDGLKILNDWYLEGLLPSDFQNIRPLTKESYEPIEKGYVGAFCAPYDYLYRNGQNAHINAFHEYCGDNANYVAVNTFENSNGEYTSWEEDYIAPETKYVYLPATCSDPLACLVYLNWISSADNIVAVQDVSISNTNSKDPYTYDRYLITCNGQYPGGYEYSDDEAEFARKTAMDVDVIQCRTLCVGYSPDYFKFISTDVDYSLIYPGSTEKYVCEVICSAEGTYDDVREKSYQEYYDSGANQILRLRTSEWYRVKIQGNMYPV